MKAKANKRTKPRAGTSGRSGVFVIAVMLALSAFGLWRCIEDDEGPLSPAEQESIGRRRVVIGRGIEVDTTILDEQALIRQAAPDAEASRHVSKGKGADKKDKPQARSEVSAAVSQPPAPPKVPVELPPAPAPPRFPLYAVAYQFHSQVRDQPDEGARVVGYARRGSTFRVSEKLRGKGCDKGWHEIEPGGYFICAGVGVIVGKEPVSFAPSPVQARREADLPYEYRYVAGVDAIQYWKAPSVEEERAAQDALRAEQAGAEELDRDALSEVLARARAMDGEAVDAPAPQAAPPVNVPDTDTAGGPQLPSYVHMPLRKGFFVSADGVLGTPAGAFVRTVRGRFVREQQLTAAKPSTFAGMLLGRGASLPMGFIVGSGVQYLSRVSEAAPLKSAGEAVRYQRLSIGEEIKYKGKSYYSVGQGRYLAAKVVAVARPATPPAGLGEGERWIDINLAEQTLVAYEGDRPVFATLVSTGRPGFETPTGSFRIYGKHLTITMDDTAAGDESYSIEDVPWTQFFKDSFALHAAFWHDRFGRVRSHGCVNLSPADARRLFQWTGPDLPSGLHGAVASRDNPGTRVVIH